MALNNSTPTMAMNSFWASGGVGRKRVSSSRSPAMVKTRKSSHHATAALTLPVASQSRLPTSQQPAARVRMIVNTAT
jgi:hypothetical protein